MFGIPIRVPFLIVILLASVWVFVQAWWIPGLLEQKPLHRIYVSILEALLSSLIWGILLNHYSHVPVESLFLSAFSTGAIWFCVVLYSRNCYVQAIDGFPKRKKKPVERSY